MAKIDDVAKLAGVSPSTVSYALSGKRKISESTRLRVEAAVQKLGYRPHAGAAALASSRTSVLGLMLPLRPGVNMSVMMEITAGVLTGARELGHDVLVVTADEEGGVTRLGKSSLIDSLVVLDVADQDERLAEMRALGVRSVVVGLPEGASGLACLDFDFEAAGRMGHQALLAKGCAHTALIGAPPAVYARGTSFARRMKQGFLSCGRGVLVPTEATIAGGMEAAAHAIEQVPELDGLVVHNEGALPGVLMALAALERCVEVVAVAPSSVVASVGMEPRLIELPTAELGRRAVDMALNPEADVSVPVLIAPLFAER